MKNSFLYKTLQQTEFDFFHPEGSNEESGIFNDIKKMINEDTRYIQNNAEFEKKHLTFPEHTLFFNGCIRIRPKQ